jgi:hypothetical protein
MKKEYNKKYQEENKLILKEKRKIYNEANKEKIKENNKKYREKNKEKRNDLSREWRLKNKKEVSNYNEKYQKENRLILKEKKRIYDEKNRKKRLEYLKEYNLKNKKRLNNLNKEWKKNNNEKIEKYKKENKTYFNEYVKNRRLSDPLFKIKENIKSLIRQSIKRGGYSKKTKTQDILGCSFEEFKIHLEKQFEHWMNWENYGKYQKDTFNFGWDIDHITPNSSALTEEKIIELNHYYNLQPLCSKINRDVKKDSLFFYVNKI